MKIGFIGLGQMGRGMAARLLDMHPQTLRKYERLGLVRPLRTLGSMRVYTRDELDRLRLIKTLVDEEGINLAGVQRLLRLADIARRLRPLVSEQRRNARGNLQLAALAVGVAGTVGDIDHGSVWPQRSRWRCGAPRSSSSAVAPSPDS